MNVIIIWGLMGGVLLIEAKEYVDSLSEQELK
ncbi:MAG: hypothetical protein ACJAX4_004095 [Clostridium sp.]|jgi:hypothetical protein